MDASTVHQWCIMTIASKLWSFPLLHKEQTTQKKINKEFNFHHYGIINRVFMGLLNPKLTSILCIILGQFLTRLRHA